MSSPSSPRNLRSALTLDFPQSLGVYDDYAQAQRVVDYLADHEFPVQYVMIVGTELKQLERITGHTIVNRRRLTAELRRIRERGYALNDQEIADGLRGVAAPVLSASGRPIAAMNVSIPHPLRAAGEIEDVLAPMVIRTAGAIGELAAKLAIERA